MVHPFSESQLKVLAIAPKITSCLSIIGSSYIVWNVLRSPKRRKRVQYRLLLAMSVLDAASSIAYFLSTWPMPSNVPFPYSAGTRGTCVAQGFFVQAGHSVLVYNAALSLFYFFYVRSNFSTTSPLPRLMEPVMHLAALYPIVGGILAAVDDSINVAGPVACWIGSVPPGCRGEAECLRGARAWLYRYVFAVGTVLLCLAVATAAQLALCVIVRRRKKTWEEAARRAASTRALPSGGPAVLSGLVVRQAALYLGASYFTWAIPLALRWYQTSTGKLPYCMLVFFAVVMPMQGVFNVLVYMRPTKMRLGPRRQYWHHGGGGSRAVEAGDGSVSKGGNGNVGGEKTEIKVEEDGQTENSSEGNDSTGKSTHNYEGQPEIISSSWHGAEDTIESLCHSVQLHLGSPYRSGAVSSLNATTLSQDQSVLEEGSGREAV